MMIAGIAVMASQNVIEQEQEIEYLLKNKAKILLITDNAYTVLACFRRLEEARTLANVASRFTEIENCLNALNLAILKETIELNVDNGTQKTLQCSGRYLTRLSGNIFTLPEYQLYWATLKVLALGENKLKSIPEEIKQLKNLKRLYLAKNMLQSLPSSIGDLQVLETLDIHDNHIKTLPREIEKLVNLSELMLDNNCLENLPNNLEETILRDRNYRPITKSEVLAQQGKGTLSEQSRKLKP